ncbi:hypothetical protein RRG08_057338 [Elysia crispata]|uniref:Uncharacterized protein n=1 Tax=Elysia crispata TaxID=231223 RepID=A0AAE1CZT6_9GAST|nr:hypothetical protein RRG08_057338 [Elysia crispata]
MVGIGKGNNVDMREDPSPVGGEESFDNTNVSEGHIGTPPKQPKNAPSGILYLANPPLRRATIQRPSPHHGSSFGSV